MPPRDVTRDPSAEKEPGEDARKRNFEDRPVFYSIQILAMTAYIAGVASLSAHFTVPAQQLVLGAGLALGLLLLKLVRAVHR